MDINIFSATDTAGRDKQILEVFRFQYQHNEVYRRFAGLTGRTPDKVKRVEDIPFLPVEMFKTHQVVSAGPPYDAVFRSSGTSGMTFSRHYVKNLALYREAFLRGFEMFYGPVSQYVILALLPSYLEREGSSLVYMVSELIRMSGKDESGFYLKNTEDLIRQMEKSERAGQKTVLIGVSFALLDLAETVRMNLKHTIVMETGGMKGRRKEITRMELHEKLMEAFGVDAIHSEYGMTELLSQAYSKGEGKFRTPPWMKILIRDSEDPLAYLPAGKTGGINIIDLANIYSCSFLATQDLGKINDDGTFDVLGRFDNSDVRGCNLLIAE